VSGFGIIVGSGAAPDAHREGRLAAGIARRGPHGSSVRRVGTVTMVHAQFVSTPEALEEDQPARHATRDWWVTADARIDNRDVLARELEGRVAHPLVTDVDYLLAAYERWGPDLAAHLLGDFAFAVWDAERERLLLVRDHLGIRPLHWSSAVDGGIVAASTLRATLEASGVAPRPDPVFLADHARFAGHQVHRTPWAGVHRLPRASTLTFEAGSGPRQRRYWAPGARRRHLTDEQAAAGLRGVFDVAMRARLRTSRPVGVEVSGGFDSTVVAAAAARAAGADDVRGYALVYPGLACDESPYIDAVQRATGIEVRRLDATRTATYDFHAACLDSLDVPSIPDEQQNVPLARLAAEDGCRVLLTGQGGDHALYGLSMYVAVEQLLERLPLTAWRTLRRHGWSSRASARELGLAYLRAWETRRPRSLAGRSWRRVRAWNQRLTDSRSATLLAPSLRTALPPGVRPPRPFGRGYSYVSEMTKIVEYWDRKAELGGVELRHPFLDVRVVEYALGLREATVATGDDPRGLMALAFGSLLPEEVRTRTNKADFRDPWVAAALPVARRAAAVGGTPATGLVDVGALSDASDRIERGGDGDVGLWPWWGAAGVALWAAAMAERATGR
jgi:asparagine synthase (glutamine-hydrolysing)